MREQNGVLEKYSGILTIVNYTIVYYSSKLYCSLLQYEILQNTIGFSLNYCCSKL